MKQDVCLIFFVITTILNLYCMQSWLFSYQMHNHDYAHNHSHDDSDGNDDNDGNYDAGDSDL